MPFGATLRSLALRPGDSLTAPESGFVDELQVLGFPHTCHPSYGGLASTPAGFAFLLNTLAFIGHTEKMDSTGSLVRQERLGGLLNYYYRRVA